MADTSKERKVVKGNPDRAKPKTKIGRGELNENLDPPEEDGYILHRK